MTLSRTTILALVSLALSACEGDQKAAGAITIGMIPKLTGIPYFNACQRGAEEAARELGVKLVYDGPLTADAARQNEIVNAWILKGFHAIAVAPNNPEAMAGVLAKARERGLRVVSWDTDALPGPRELFCNQLQASAMAAALLEILHEELKGAGRVALVSGTETAANQNAWMALMREQAKAKYPKLVLLDPPEYPGEDDARAYAATQGLLRRSDRPDAVVGMTSVSAPAAAKAVFDSGLAGKVAVTGITSPQVMRPYVKNGTVKKFVLWSPIDLGYLTIHAAARLARGGPVPSEIDAGRLGKLKVENGQALLGPPLVFTAETIDRYDF